VFVDNGIDPAYPMRSRFPLRETKEQAEAALRAYALAHDWRPA